MLYLSNDESLKQIHGVSLICNDTWDLVALSEQRSAVTCRSMFLCAMEKERLSYSMVLKDYILSWIDLAETHSHAVVVRFH